MDFGPRSFVWVHGELNLDSCQFSNTNTQMEPLCIENFVFVQSEKMQVKCLLVDDTVVVVVCVSMMIIASSCLSDHRAWQGKWAADVTTTNLMLLLPAGMDYNVKGAVSLLEQVEKDNLSSSGEDGKWNRVD